ncbi:MAG TPA: LptF/LptG family permease, partial [Gemmatimonadales bacterium]|nr:LptF/LptG family permease [Gemmatimonadales bacterium]
DAATGRLREVTIYDMGGDANRRIIYADSGLMAYAEGQTDLSLRLYDGSIHQYRPVDPMGFQLTYFRVNDIRVKNVFDELQRNTSEAVRGDREMSTCEMLEVIRDADREGIEAAHDRNALLRSDLRALLALPPLPEADSLPAPGPLPAYCGWMQRLQELVLPTTAEAQAPAQSGAGSSQGVGSGQAAPAVPRPRTGGLREPPLSNWSLTATALDRAQDAERRAARYAVEVHKKWAISTACMSFVIIGIVLALRFPRGGIGLVIGGGLLVFSVHYIGLTAGESLADRGHVSPWAAMWTPNIVLTVLGILGIIRVSRESGSTRGGDFQEVLDALRHLWRRLRQRQSSVRLGLRKPA